MIKRTIEISKEAVHLSVKHEQLLLQRHEPETGVLASIPCEDIGVIVIDHPQTTYSHHALARLVAAGAVVLICGRDHLPCGMLLPLSQNTEIVPRIGAQINASKPTQKRIWQQIIRAKIQAQAANLNGPALSARAKLLKLAGDVKSGDPANVEAYAARVYWEAWLRGTPDAPNPRFRRDKDGKDYLNILLNYGYAVHRAAVARAIVSAGLVAALGVHHSHRANAFALADDLLEPLRPMVDGAVRHQHAIGTREINRTAKAALLGTLVTTVRTGDATGPLLVHLHRYVASFLRVLRGEEKKLSIPRMIDEADGSAEESHPASEP